MSVARRPVHRRARGSSRATARRTTRTSPSGCARRARSSSARPTWTSSRWARRPSTRPTARPPTRGRSTACPGGSSGGSAAAVAAFHAPLVDRHRHRRLDPPAGRAVRDRRHEADLRPGQPLRDRRLRELARPDRAVRPRRARRGGAAPRGRRPRRPRFDLVARAGPGDADRAAGRRRRGRGARCAASASACRASTSWRAWSRASRRASARRSRRSRRPARPSRRSACRTPTTAWRRTTSSRRPRRRPTSPATTGSATGRGSATATSSPTTWRTRGQGFGPEVKRRIMLGTYALSAGYYDAYYLKAQKVRTLIKGDFDALWAQGFDALVAPTSPTVAFRFGDRLADPVSMYLSDACTLPVNMAGLPGVSIPCGLSDGLPVGLQLIGAAVVARPRCSGWRAATRRSPRRADWRGDRADRPRERRRSAGPDPGRADRPRRPEPRLAARCRHVTRPDRTRCRTLDADDRPPAHPAGRARPRASASGRCRRRASAASSTSRPRWTTSSASGVGEPDFDTPRVRSSRPASRACARAGRTTPATTGTLELRRALAAHLERRYGVAYDPATRDPGHGRRVGGGRPRARARRATRATRSSSTSRRTSPTSPAIIVRRRRRPARRDALRGRLRARPGGGRGRDHAADQGALPRLSVQSRPAPCCPTTSRTRSPTSRSATTCSSTATRSTTGSPTATYRHRAMSALPGMRERTILMGGFSKAYAMTGWRVGYVCAPAAILEGMRQGPPVRDHVGRRRPPRTRRWPRSRGRAGRRSGCWPSTTAAGGCSSTGSTRSGSDTFEPRGAFYAFPRIASTGLDDEAFAERLLTEEHVAVVPGQCLRAVGRGPRPDVLRDVVRAARGGAGADRPVRRADPCLRARPRRQRARETALERYEAVIGIEVHCQLRTASKMFCGCSTDYDGAPPNSHVCPVCLGLPGALPTINRRAVEHVLATGLAIEATTPDGDPLGPQELLLPGPAQGLPDQPVRPAARVARAADVRHVGRAVHGRRSPAPTSRRTRPSSSTRTDADGPRGQPRRLQPVRRAADGDRHRARHPDRRAGPPLRRGAAAAAALDRRVGRRHGARPDAGRGERLAPAARHGAVRDAGRGQEHELVPLRGAGDRLRDRAPGRGARRRRAAHPGDARLGRRPAARPTACGPRRRRDDYRYFPEPDLPPLHVDAAWLAAIRAALPELPAARRDALPRRARPVARTTRRSSSPTRT